MLDDGKRICCDKVMAFYVNPHDDKDWFYVCYKCGKTQRPPHLASINCKICGHPLSVHLDNSCFIEGCLCPKQISMSELEVFQALDRLGDGK